MMPPAPPSPVQGEGGRGVRAGAAQLTKRRYSVAYSRPRPAAVFWNSVTNSGGA